MDDKNRLNDGEKPQTPADRVVKAKRRLLLGQGGGSRAGVRSLLGERGAVPAFRVRLVHRIGVTPQLLAIGADGDVL